MGQSIITRRRFFAAGAGALVSSAALALPVAQAVEEPIGEALIRQRMWDMAHALYQNDRGHWRVAVDLEKHFAMFLRLGNEPQNGLFFTELQP